MTPGKVSWLVKKCRSLLFLKIPVSNQFKQKIQKKEEQWRLSEFKAKIVNKREGVKRSLKVLYI